MTSKLSIPTSPTWETVSDVSISEIPNSFKWTALVSRVLQYPNIGLQSDSETTEDFQKEFITATLLWKKPCRHIFPCQHGRQNLSNKQKKQKCGIPYNKSLCGQCILNHLVNKKWEEYENTTAEDISAWYYDSDDDSEAEDEDEDIYEKMQLRRTPSGTLEFSDTYISTLRNGIEASSAA
jgi:hypothetical protein